MTNHQKKQTRGIMFASFTALMWGFLAIALKIGTTSVDPITLSWFRFSFAGSALFLILGKFDRKEINILKRPPWLALLAGLGLCLNYVWYITGLSMTSPSNAQVIIQLAPVLLALVGIVILREKINKIQLVGFVVALTGFYVFYQNQLGVNLGDISIYNQGSLFVVFGALAWVIYAIIQKLLVQKYNPQSINLIIYLFSSIALLPFIDYDVFYNLSFGMWMLMGFLGLNTLLAYGFLGEAFRHADANKVGIVITLNPMITIFVMGILTSMEVSWIQPEHINLITVLSAIMVIGGAILAVRSKK